MRNLMIAVLFCFSASANAGVFAGLRTVNILVEELPGEAKGCGIQKADIETAAAFTVSQSKLRINEKARWYLYYRVFVRSLAPIKGCAIYVGLQARMRAIAEHNKTTEWASFWDYSSFGVVSESDANKKISDSVDGITKAFLVEWSKDN